MNWHSLSDFARAHAVDVAREMGWTSANLARRYGVVSFDVIAFVQKAGLQPLEPFEEGEQIRAKLPEGHDLRTAYVTDSGWIAV